MCLVRFRLQVDGHVQFVGNETNGTQVPVLHQMVGLPARPRAARDPPLHDHGQVAGGDVPNLDPVGVVAGVEQPGIGTGDDPEHSLGRQRRPDTDPCRACTEEARIQEDAERVEPVQIPGGPHDGVPAGPGVGVGRLELHAVANHYLIPHEVDFEGAVLEEDLSPAAESRVIHLPVLEQLAGRAEAHAVLAVLELEGVAGQFRQDRVRVRVRPRLAGAVPDAPGCPEKCSESVEGLDLHVPLFENDDRAVAQPRGPAEALELLFDGIVPDTQRHDGLVAHLPPLTLVPQLARVYHHAHARAVGYGERGRWGFRWRFGARHGEDGQHAGPRRSQGLSPKAGTIEYSRPTPQYAAR